MADILITNGTVITMDKDRRVLDGGAVAIEGTYIAAVGETETLRRTHPASRVIDASRKVVMPGLIDGHAHAGRDFLEALEKAFALAVGAVAAFLLALREGAERTAKRSGVAITELRVEVNELLEILLNTPNIVQRMQGVGRLEPKVARDYKARGVKWVARPACTASAPWMRTPVSAPGPGSLRTKARAPILANCRSIKCAFMVTSSRKQPSAIPCQRKERESNPQGLLKMLDRLPTGSRRQSGGPSICVLLVPRPGLEPGTPR